MLVLEHVELLNQELELCYQGLVLELVCHIELLVLQALGQQDIGFLNIGHHDLRLLRHLTPGQCDGGGEGGGGGGGGGKEGLVRRGRREGDERGLGEGGVLSLKLEDLPG